MSSRRYVKRIWRVPKRGALECFATLVTKTLVKHGWPAKWEPVPFTEGFQIVSHDHGENLPDDFLEAVSIAAAILARTYRVEIEVSGNWIGFLRLYQVTPRGQFKELKDDPTG